MTIPESAATRFVESAPSRAARHSALERLGRWVAARGWIHVLLFTGVVGCVYPIVWMFMTSIKTDEELGQAAMTPSLPTFREESPYVRAPADIVTPEGVEPALFASTLPRLRDRATEAIASSVPADAPPRIDRHLWITSATSVLVNRTLAQMARRLWEESADAATRRFEELLTPEAVSLALSDQLCRFELSAPTMRTLDGRLIKLGADGPSTGWIVGTGRASLVPAADSLRVDYRFDSGSDAPVVLAYEFAMPEGVEPSDIHKIFMSIRSDDSWHGLGATLDVGKTHWKSTRTTYLAQNRAQIISFQPPTFDDTTIRARTWVPLRAAGTTDRTRNARLELVLTPSSTLAAAAAKVERNYVRAFDSVPFLTYVGNSLLLVLLMMAGFLFSSAFVAYAFARLTWPGRSIALVLLLATMMVPPQVTMIPSFLVWRGLGCYDTLYPLWIPAWMGSAFFIFLMIQHMKTIPKELEEAARIDGLGIVKTWWYVIVPQLKPTLAAIAIMSFLGAWNEFMGPLIYLRDQAKFPLSLGLFGMRIDQGADWSMLMAANMLMTLPSIFVFFAFQRYFIEGMTVTGMKG